MAIIPPKVMYGLQLASETHFTYFCTDCGCQTETGPFCIDSHKTRLLTLRARFVRQ